MSICPAEAAWMFILVLVLPAERTERSDGPALPAAGEALTLWGDGPDIRAFSLNWFPLKAFSEAAWFCSTEPVLCFPQKGSIRWELPAFIGERVMRPLIMLLQFNRSRNKPQIFLSLFLRLLMFEAAGKILFRCLN